MDAFQRRMFEAAEEVYGQIEQGQPIDVEAALMEAQYEASQPESE